MYYIIMLFLVSYLNFEEESLKASKSVEFPVNTTATVNIKSTLYTCTSKSHTHTHARTHACMHGHMHTHRHAVMHTHTHRHTHRHAHTHIHTQTQTHTTDTTR